MIKKLLLFLNILIFSGFILGCQSEEEVTEIFDYDLFENIDFHFGETEENFLFVSGNNIAIADYNYSNNTLTFKKEYLVYLAPDNYAFDVHFIDEIFTVHIDVLDRNQENRIINGDFETGDLFGWTSKTVFKGENQLQTYSDDNIVSSSEFLGQNLDENDYILGYNQTDISKTVHEEKMGYLRSTDFILGGSGFISIDLGVAANPNICFISIKKSINDEEIARVSNSRFDVSQIEYIDEQHIFDLNTYVLDLSEYINDSLYLELHDLGGLNNDFLVVDNINTYHEVVPDFGYNAIDFKPNLMQSFIPNQLINGDFEFGLDYYSEINPYDSFIDTYHVDGNVLKSNLEGDDGLGLLRSSVFQLNGTGIISLELAAAQGERYDKNTYVSIRLASTNEEIYRFANERHNGTEFVKYFIDLDIYIGEDLYFEFIDNAMGSYGTLFVRNIITYYPTLEAYDYAMVAENLNY